MNADEKIQKLLQMQKQGESIESICQALEMGSSRALSNLANRKGYKFDRTHMRYIAKDGQEQRAEPKKQEKKLEEGATSKIERLENEIRDLHKLINAKDMRIQELEEELSIRSLKVHNARGAGRPNRLSDAEKESAKMYRIQGKTLKEISEIYKCSTSLIHKIINEKL